MISQDEIKKIINKNQTTQLNIRREYLQHLFLSYFYKQPQTEAIYFKGGTALRVIYQSPRFSEDLDFSTGNDITTIENVIIQTLTEIEKTGVNTQLKEAKKTSGGYLAAVVFDFLGQTISILLQISLRQGKQKGEVVTIVSDFILPYIVISLSRQQLIDEKMQALLSRQKPRDFYDLYFILRSNLLLPEKKAILSKALKILQDSDLNFEK
ncbi:MAG: nucleotidyl transferase AbiEii/AbiGii toxin family protein, partial [Candidatus Levybacteria bacterium]|nr:nucleotidyl transferase AbiEii/AbiGii toxin family protein [Candidatus Levybacteria bacterium]